MSGLIQIQRRENLTAAECNACQAFRTMENLDSSDSNVKHSFVEAALKRRRAKSEQYPDVSFVPPTSNEGERFFPSVKLVYTDWRRRMGIDTLEAVMILMYNRDFWDVRTVSALQQSIPERDLK